MGENRLNNYFWMYIGHYSDIYIYLILQNALNITRYVSIKHV